ncbi:MAG: 1,4-dihydroxy-6-naphthoate synthase [Bacteroidales bacterium]
MNLQLAFSSCPNDTFMFDAWVHKRIAVPPYHLQLHVADIEELNHMALSGLPDIVKVSYALYPRLRNQYQLLTAGSALGYGSGPLVVSRHKLYPDELPHAVVAIPGAHTTAALLLRALFPGVKRVRVYLFSNIEEAVLSGEADAGVLIHETRFTYAKKGLQKVADLGLLWEEATSLPVPLGAIAVRRSLPDEVKHSLNVCMRNSVAFALENREASRSFVQHYAREIDHEVCKRHIDLYVNEFSVDIGEVGKRAVAALLEKVLESDTSHASDLPIFVCS